MKKSPEMPKYYRMLQVLNAQFSFCCKTFYLPLFFLTLTVVYMLGSYATIRLFHEVKMPGFLGFPLATLAVILIILEIIPMAYKMRKASFDLLRSMRKVTLRSAYFYKVMASCKPLGVDTGPFFTIRQGTTFTLLQISISNTITLLLGF